MLRPERSAGPEERGTWPGHSETSPQPWGLPASPGTRHWAGGLHPSSPLNPSSNPGRPVLLMSQKGETEFQTHGQPVQVPEGCGWRSWESQPGQSVCKARGPLRVHTPSPAFPLVNTASAYGGAFQPPHLRPSPAPGSSERQDFHSQKCRRREDQTVLSMCRMRQNPKKEEAQVDRGVQEGFLEEGVGLQMVSDCSLWKPQDRAAKTTWG